VYDQLRHEVRSYSEELARKPHVVLFSKRDLLPPGDPLPALESPNAIGTLAFSAVSSVGLEELKEYLWKAVEAARAEEHA
jgi:GTPase involved in cell partitioning and DNA repair